MAAVVVWGGGRGCYQKPRCCPCGLAKASAIFAPSPHPHGSAPPPCPQGRSAGPGLVSRVEMKGVGGGGGAAAGADQGLCALHRRPWCRRPGPKAGAPHTPTWPRQFGHKQRAERHVSCGLGIEGNPVLSPWKTVFSPAEPLEGPGRGGSRKVDTGRQAGGGSYAVRDSQTWAGGRTRAAAWAGGCSGGP